MNFQIKWLGTACFQIRLPNGTSLVIDPYIDDAVTNPLDSGCIDNCSSIYITHGHYDHVLDVCKLVERFDCSVFCNSTTRSSLIEHQSVPAGLIHTIQPGSRLDEADWTVDVVSGEHIDVTAAFNRLAALEKGVDDSGRPNDYRVFKDDYFANVRLPEKLDEWSNAYPGGEQLNFLIQLHSGLRIYVAGTYPSETAIKTAETANADITLLQVTYGRLLEGLEEATVDLAMASGCRTAIAQHHDPLYEGLPGTDLQLLHETFKKKSAIDFVELVPGQYYDF